MRFDLHPACSALPNQVPEMSTAGTDSKAPTCEPKQAFKGVWGFPPSPGGVSIGPAPQAAHLGFCMNDEIQKRAANPSP